MRVLAPAKVNLFLSVGARRPDSLHEIVSVMQTVSLADVVGLETAERFSISVTPPGAAPADETNLALRAARALTSLRAARGAIALTIEKRIPVAAGLAGGSADAAAALVGVNEMLQGRVSRKALQRVGAALGADVPFCLEGGTAVVRGAGEDVSPIPARAPLWWVIGLADTPLATAEVYRRFDDLGGGTTADPWEVADALARGEVDRVAAHLRNDLQPAAEALAPEVGRGGAALTEAGAVGAVLSGSGPTWIGLCRDEDHARAVAARAAGSFARVEVARSLDHGPRIIHERAGEESSHGRA